MHKVRLRKQIHASMSGLSSNDIWLYWDVELPFPPYIGLEIEIVKKDIWATIEGVYYSIPEGRFHAFTPEDKELYEAHSPGRWNPDIKIRSVEEVAQEYLHQGWKREEED